MARLAHHDSVRGRVHLGRPDPVYDYIRMRRCGKRERGALSRRTLGRIRRDLVARGIESVRRAGGLTETAARRAICRRLQIYAPTLRNWERDGLPPDESAAWSEAVTALECALRRRPE